MYRIKNLEKKYIVIIILVVIMIIFAVFAFTIKDKKNLNIFEKSIKDSGLFITKIVTKPFDLIKEKKEESKEKNDIYNKYKKLKKKYEKTKLLEAKYKEVNKQLHELQDNLKINTSLVNSSYLNATVINRNLGHWYNTITIDKGSKNGVKKGFAVITSKGLIGSVTNVSNFNSTVKLLTNKSINNKISVKIEVDDDKYIFGLLTGYDEKTKCFQIEGISENTEIPKDAMVTTTGMGDDFPSGILIGTVKRVSTDNFDLARTVIVEPYVNFDDINYVTVLKRESKK